MRTTKLVMKLKNDDCPAIQKCTLMADQSLGSQLLNKQEISIIIAISNICNKKFVNLTMLIKLY